jgi:Zn-dependent alcohol dehydrogenase
MQASLGTLTSPVDSREDRPSTSRSPSETSTRSVPFQISMRNSYSDHSSNAVSTFLPQLKIPDSVTDEQALYLSDVLPTSYNAVVNTELEKGDIVGIWGAGPIGQCAAKWCILLGASKVVMIDLVQDRLDFAVKENGSDKVEYINASNGTKVAEEILKRYPSGLGTSSIPFWLFYRRCYDSAATAVGRTREDTTVPRPRYTF